MFSTKNRVGTSTYNISFGLFVIFVTTLSDGHSITRSRRHIVRMINIIIISDDNNIDNTVVFSIFMYYHVISFLYWTQRGSGIYRADLRPTFASAATSAGGDTARRPASDATSYHRIVRQKNPGPFIVDCVDYRMYYVSDEAADKSDDNDDAASTATLMSADLDGTGSLPVRESTATGETSSSDWTSLTALARHRPTGSFYWSTAAGRLWAEELDPTSASTGTSPGVYHQNQMLVDGKHFAGVSVWHSTSQPVPGRGNYYYSYEG